MDPRVWAAVVRALIRRRLDHYRLSLRALRHPAMGFPLRPGPSAPVVVVEPRLGGSQSRQPVPPAGRAVVGLAAGLLDAGTHDSLALAARFYGLELERVPVMGLSSLLKRAAAERWPLVGVTPDSTAPAPDSEMPSALEAFLASGGTLLLNGLRPTHGRTLEELGKLLSLELPSGSALTSSAITFTGEHPDFAAELVGVEIPAEGSSQWQLSGAGEVLAWSVGARVPVVMKVRRGNGSVVLSGLGGPVAAGLPSALEPDRAAAVLPAMMAVRSLYGVAAWRPPARFANFTIDDPALRSDLLGFDYRRVAEVGDEAGFHLTVATIPAELGTAERDVVGLLRERRDRISACYHGYRHLDYEFYLPKASNTRFRPRALDRQKRDLRRATERARSFATRYPGYALDRVMVFPHGIGPAEILPELGQLGFVASSNASDRYPLGSDGPRSDLAGLRPADLEWGGFPLMWRRPLDDPATFAYDLFLGRPAVAFAHRDVGRDLRPLAERAAVINRLAGGAALWQGLEEIARHCYVQRWEPGRGWQVEMLTNEACLHNPDGSPRRYEVRRPYLPPSARLIATGQDELEGGGEGGGVADGEGRLAVEVPAAATVIVRVVYPQGARLPAMGRTCPIFADSAGSALSGISARASGYMPRAASRPTTIQNC